MTGFYQRTKREEEKQRGGVVITFCLRFLEKLVEKFSHNTL